MLFVVLAGVIWGIGAALKAPPAQRAAGVAALWAAFVLGALALPAESALRAATGASPAPWLLLGAAVALVMAYRAGMARLRRRIAAAAPAVAAPRLALSDAELDRYARHIVLREVGGTGQKALKSARVLVVGAGGLGSPALLYLAASGVGTLGVIDDDSVAASNLQRQIIHTDDRIGMAKVRSAAIAIRALNPFVTVRPYERRLTADIAADLFADYDVILDGSDNFATRYLVNAAAIAAGKPLVSGALTQWEGQISLFHPVRGGPCYRCVFPEAPAPGLAPSCAEAGVIAPLPGVIGAMMALEAVKAITGAGEGLRGQMLIYDGLWGETRRIAVARRADCPDCGAIDHLA